MLEKSSQDTEGLRVQNIDNKPSVTIHVIKCPVRKKKESVQMFCVNVD